MKVFKIKDRTLVFLYIVIICITAIFLIYLYQLFTTPVIITVPKHAYVKICFRKPNMCTEFIINKTTIIEINDTIIPTTEIIYVANNTIFYDSMCTHRIILKVKE